MIVSAAPTTRPTLHRTALFEVCDGEDQDFPGGLHQQRRRRDLHPTAESLGAITSMPYTARLPASSNCVQYQSQQLYAAVASVFPTTSTTSSSAKATGTSSGAKGSGSAAGASGSKTASGAGASNTANAGSSVMLNRHQGALGAVLGVMAGVSGVLFSVAFLA